MAGSSGGGGAGGVSLPRRTSAPAVSVGRGMTPLNLGSPTSTSRQAERTRERLSQGVASQDKTENLQEESPHNIIHIIRLMLSCLHAWKLDDELDQSCEEVLGLVRPSKPVSFGLLSKGGCMSLVLPGWGLRTRLHRTDTSHIAFLPERDKKDSSEVELSLDSPALSIPESGIQPKLASSFSPSTGSNLLTYTFDQKYHLRWQLSRALTTQHLLTMVSITNTLMNQTIGAHQLAGSSATRQRHDSHDDSDSDGEDSTAWDNQIRAVWSRVNVITGWAGISGMAGGGRGAAGLRHVLQSSNLHVGGCLALCDAS